MAESNYDDRIRIEDYIVIQRQDYKKLHKLKRNDCVRLGKHNVELNNIVEQEYNSTFKLESLGKNKFTLKKVEFAKQVALPKDRECGDDNRGIRDDGKSQKLTTEDITKLQENAVPASEIITQIVSNSTTFASKTEFSQEKYINKKEKKYYEYIQIIKPTILNMIEIYYRLSPAKILGMRIDDIAQILYYSNVNCYGNYLIYESGSCGLPVAAMLERIGANTPGKLIHVHPGNEPQRQAIMAMKFPQEQLDRYINVNLYSVLRYYYQKYKKGTCAVMRRDEKLTGMSETIPKDIEMKSDEPSAKKIRLNEETEVMSKDEKLTGISETVSKDAEMEGEEPSAKKIRLNEKTEVTRDQSVELISKPVLLEKKWQFDNHRTCEIFDEKLDGLVIIAKEDPISIIDAFIDFVNLSRPIVVFADCIQILTNLYMHLKRSKKVTYVRLTNGFLRNIQVLPDRTHPDVNRNFGGYLLTGYTANLE